MSANLHRYTGGNPLFIVETVKNLIESGRFGPSLPRPLGLGGKVTSLIAQRLERLSAPARRLAWTAAVARSDFSLELTSQVLETNPLELAEPYGELERAQIFTGSWFSHDLLYETALEGIPVPIRTLLHRRCATHLQTQDKNPARIAQHYLEAGDDLKAAPFLLGAAAAAKSAFQLDEAARFFEKAATVLEARGDTAGAFDARFEQVVLAILHGMKGDKEGVVAKLFPLAETPLQKAKAHYARVALLNAQGQGVESERAAREGYCYAMATGDVAVQAKLQSGLGEALYLQGCIAEASDVLEPLCDLWEGLGKEDELAAALSDVAMILDLQDRYEEAAHYYRRADALAARLGDKAKRAIILGNFGYSLRNAGFARRSIAPLNKARELLGEISGSAETRRRNLGQLGESHAQLADFALALDCLQGAILLSEEHDLPHGFLHRSLAEVYLSLGRFQSARAHIEAALQQPGLRDRLRGAIWLTKARLLVLEGEDAREAFARAEALMDLENDKMGLARFRIAQAPTFPPAQSLGHALHIVEMAKTHELGALASGAQTRCAQALLALGRPGEALRHSASAVALLETYDPVDFYRAEVLFSHVRALEAAGDPAAPGQLRRCVAWVMEVAEERTPPEYRQSFLENNPVNRTILAAARARGLITS